MCPDHDLQDPNEAAELLVSGLIRSKGTGQTSVEVRRGMAILAPEGCEVGTVAAVVVDPHGHHVTHILLSRLSPIPEYRLVPLDLVVQVRDDTVCLRISSPVVSRLATWHGS